MIGKGKSKAAASESDPKSGRKTGSVKLYSSFNPIPLTLTSPLPIPLPSSSKKPITAITHYIYVRPHRPSSASTNSASSDGRTVFVTNLPVDMGARELRAVFGTWGVVEEVTIGKEGTGDTLEKAVKGSLENEESDDDDEDEEMDDNDDEEVEGRRERAEPIFVPNEAVVLTKAQKQRRRRKRGQLPPSVPEITPLPDLNPRSEPYGPSGSRIAHVTFLDAVSIDKVMSYTGKPISLPSAPVSQKGNANPNSTGLEYYTRLHSSLRPAAAHVKAFADSSMDRYDHLHSLLLSSRARQKGVGALVDEDGFTVVVRGGRYGRTGGRGDLGSGSVGVGVAKRGMTAKEAKGGAAELTDFYKFQKVDRKRKELADLRKKFDEDKAKVEELKRSKRFKPY